MKPVRYDFGEYFFKSLGILFSSPCVCVCECVFFFAKEAINRSLIQFLCWAVLFLLLLYRKFVSHILFLSFSLTWHTNWTRCVNLINYIGKKKINSVNESIYGASVSLFQPIFQMQCVVFILDFFYCFIQEQFVCECVFELNELVCTVMKN